jgi:Cu+-exporting ATPase
LPTQVPQNKPFVVVDSTDSLKAVKVTISIVGMTCGTCVGKISESLEFTAFRESVESTTTKGLFVAPNYIF